MQLPEIWQRMNVIFLLQVGETEIELNLTQLRADAENPLICFDCLSVAMGFGIHDAEVGERAHVAGSSSRTLLKPASAAGIVA